MRILLWRRSSWIFRKAFSTWLSKMVAALWRSPWAVISPTQSALHAARSRRLNARLENGPRIPRKHNRRRCKSYPTGGQDPPAFK